MQRSRDPFFGIAHKYTAVIPCLFFIFLFGVLSLGRPFSILHLNIGPAPLFITEIVIAVCLPFVIARKRPLLELPKVYLFSIFGYFILGCIHLIIGFLSKNLFALRDIVLFAYIIFLPLCLGIFSRDKDLRFFLGVLVSANLVGILVGRMLVFEAYPWPSAEFFISQARKFNLGLYYGFAFTFLIAFFDFWRDRRIKFFILMLLALNIYMMLIIGVRAVWFGWGALFLYFIFALRTRFLKTMIIAIPVFFVFGAAVYHLDFNSVMGHEQKEYFFSKVDTLRQYSQEIFTHRQKFEKSPEKDLSPRYRRSYGNLVWRREVWRQSIDFAVISPIFGRGFGVYPRYRMEDYMLTEPTKVGLDSNVTPCHNHGITLFMKTGLLGLSLFLLINIYTIFYGIRYIGICADEFRRRFLIAAVGALIFWHGVALFFDVIDSPPTSIFLWILTGLIFAVTSIDKAYKKV